MKKVVLVVMTVMMMVNLYAQNELVIYTYDSFSWVEEKMIGEFEKQEDCKVKLVKFDNTGKILGRLKLEKKNPKADVVIGLTPTLTGEAKKENLLEKYKSPNLANIKKEDLIFDKENYVTTYDFGGLAIVYDPEKIENVPTSFEDITKLKRKLIIEDPRTSTTGQDFLLWTIAIYGDDWKGFWEKLKPAILTVTPGWSEAFSKFAIGEAPMMLSYGTDGAYSFEKYQSLKYKAFIPSEGGYVQEEGLGIAKGSKNRKMAEKFIDFVLTEKFQENIPLNQWMFPVVDVKMPKSFEYAIAPKKIVSVDAKKVSDNLIKWLDEWEKIMY